LRGEPIERLLLKSVTHLRLEIKGVRFTNVVMNDLYPLTASVILSRKKWVDPREPPPRYW
jgi:hypothetical protein